MGGWRRPYNTRSLELFLCTFLNIPGNLTALERLSIPEHQQWRWEGEACLQSDVLILVLVVEDDQLIQAMVEGALTDGGFEAAIAGTGEEAVTLLQGNNDKYRALVTDINLAGKLDGWEVAKRAREIKPDLPVIYMTGAAADQWTSHGVPNSILLTKPFAPAQVVTAVSQLLNASGALTAPT
jgi:CheY-like chemotaxis protein